MINHLDASTNWPHQQRGRDALARARAAGLKAVVGVAPPGAGKSRVMFQEAFDEIRPGGRGGRGVTILTHRAMLFAQMARQLSSLGIDYGIIAAETGIGAVDLSKPIQLASIQTLYSWAVQRSKIDLPDSSLVLIDEAHANASNMARALVYGSEDDAARFDGFIARGAHVIGFTGSPVDLGGIYEGIVSFGSYRELREVKAHLPVVVYSPSEIDCADLKPKASGEYAEGELEPRAMAIVGEAFEWWKKLNPFAEPALLFAPSVPASRWFAWEWVKRGVPAAHIGADVCLLPARLPDGSLTLDQHTTTPEIRQSILDMSQSGEIKLVCNRFILREAIDMPWIRHGIAATVFGGLATFLQSVGRIQRYHPDYPNKIWQCHGGCLDDQTEILTRDGWRSRGQIAVGDEVAAFNRETGEIVWEPIYHTHERMLEPGEKMYRLHNSRTDLRITGNHRLLYQQRTMGAGNVARWPDGYKLGRCDDLAGNVARCRMPIAGLQGSPGVPLTDAELTFLGWWITDGTMKGKRHEVNITQSNCQPWLDDIRECLRSCGLDWTERQQKPGPSVRGHMSTVFAIPKGTCKSRPRRGWWRLREYMDKDLSPLLEDMTQAQFEVFLQAVHMGDGAKDRKPGAYRICAGRKLFADRLQSLAVRRGWKCSVSEAKPTGPITKNVRYILNMQKVSTTCFHGRPTKQAAQLVLEETAAFVGEWVWCVANRYETIVVRRGGRVAIIGNSFWRHGSPNEERVWRLGDTNRSLARARRERIERSDKPQDEEGICCPKCAGWRRYGSQCPHCGHQHVKSVRRVKQLDGSLKLMTGAVTKRKPPKKQKTQQDIWLGVLWGSAHAERPVSGAVAILHARCAKEGIEVNYSALRPAPPPPDSLQWHYPVSEVFPSFKPRGKR